MPAFADEHVQNKTTYLQFLQCDISTVNFSTVLYIMGIYIRGPPPMPPNSPNTPNSPPNNKYNKDTKNDFKFWLETWAP